MCRIASFFLLQGLKGKMSVDAHDFNNIESRAIMKFFLSYSTVKNWVAHFKRGDFSTCDAPRPGRPKTVATREIIDQIHELILEDRRISAKSTAEQLGISREWVGSIMHDNLEALREVGPEMPGRGSKASTVPAF